MLGIKKLLDMEKPRFLPSSPEEVGRDLLACSHSSHLKAMQSIAAPAVVHRAVQKLCYTQLFTCPHSSNRAKCHSPLLCSKSQRDLWKRQQSKARMLKTTQHILHSSSRHTGLSCSCCVTRCTNAHNFVYSKLILLTNF